MIRLSQSQIIKENFVQFIIKILAGMVKRIDVDMKGLPLFDSVTLEEVKKVVLNERNEI